METQRQIEEEVQRLRDTGVKETEIQQGMVCKPVISAWERGRRIRSSRPG